ncbi:MAG: flagellar basal body rod protein FlgC [Chloroflexi bacterium]|nr:flagellar basal body rod protein FlgC [Chloroflexota bacterium]
MSFWDSLKIGSSALTAQRLRLDVIANNVANAETTHTADGGPYRRQDVVFTPQGQSLFLPALARALHDPQAAPTLAAGGVQVAQIVTDETEGPRVHDPSHPDADKEGYVTYPNVNLVTEMTNMLSATRSYEAALAAIESAKRMALRALEIGR